MPPPDRRIVQNPVIVKPVIARVIFTPCGCVCYTEEIRKLWDFPSTTSTCQVARLFEDLKGCLPDILEPVPEDIAPIVSNPAWLSEGGASLVWTDIRPLLDRHSAWRSTTLVASVPPAVPVPVPSHLALPMNSTVISTIKMITTVSSKMKALRLCDLSIMNRYCSPAAINFSSTSRR